MAGTKMKSLYICSECGYECPKWYGKCPSCGEWNTLQEEVRETGKSAAAVTIQRKKPSAIPVRISEITTEDEQRYYTGLKELDRVLGGGIVKGSLVLLGGDPGIGKSTILLQICHHLGKILKILYISGEESLHQIRMRSDRIGEAPESLYLLAETNLTSVSEVIRSEKPEICVIDSIQTMYNEDVSSAPGSVSQVREATGVLLMLAKSMDISIFIVGHVTKDGAVAGPRVLEHMVDTVLYFEGDRHASYRILRAVKNRFGSTNEIGVFEMREKGLEEVPNPSEYMLSGKPEDSSGSIVACSVEGTRPLLIEIQALVCKTNFQLPRRTAAGTDFNRVNLLMAVLERRCGYRLGTCDAYVNIAGGIKITEPAVDLGIVLALVSGYRDVPIGNGVVAFGEVGLSGEVRAVSQAELRVSEARKLGFKRVILPKANMKTVKQMKGIEIVPVVSLADAIREALAGKKAGNSPETEG